MRGLRVSVAVAVVGLLGVGAASAGATTYNLAGTKACLVKKGAQLQSPQTGAQATLPPAERLESLVGTLPGGSEPLFLYMAIARTSSQALAIRKALEKTIVPAPTKTSSWSGQKANAAWIVVSITGASPGAAAKKLVLGCLTKGKPPTSPARYAKSDVALCIQANGRASVASASDVSFFLGPIPPKLAPHLVFAFTSTPAARADGLRLFVLFGKTHADALALRAQLDHALGGKVLGPAIWRGSKKNVAWAASRLRGTTPAGIASGKRTLLSCLP